MTITQPLYLALSVLPLAYFIYEWRSGGRRLAFVLKITSLLAILAALSEPVITLPETKTGVVVLADTSGSISDQDLAQAGSLVGNMAQAVGSNWMRVIPFARQARDLTPEEVREGWRLKRTANEDGQATDIEAAIREGVSAIPDGRVPRLVLISDGKENEGSSARAIAQAQRLGIPIDTFLLAGRAENGLRLLSVSIPSQAYAGEKLPIDLTVQSPGAVPAAVTISAEGKELGENPVELNRGITQVHVRTQINTSGSTTVGGRLKLRNGATVEFEQALNLKRAQVLYISHDPVGSGNNFLQALNQAQFDMKTDPHLLDSSLNAFQLVVLNNLDLQAISKEQKSHLEEYVKNGGGLLLIGGEKQVYKEKKQEDALDRVLPAELAPPKSPEGTCVALIIDKSSSMEGRKIELARLSAIGVVDHLRPTDLIGVLIFDNSYQWAVPIRRAEDKSLIKRLISGITPDGGTQIAPALTEAYRKILAARATYRHIVLLTDGISEEGDSLELAKEAQNHQVTISTVGLGQDVNRGYLDRVANLSGGKSYFLNEPQGLQQLLLRDVLEYTGTTAVERSLKALVDSKAEVLEGTGIESAPSLKGYARYRAKSTAETLLSIDEGRRDPLYVRWQYGLGRAAVFASDAKSRWAADWIGWPGFDKFWINVTRDLLPHSSLAEAVAQFDPANNDLVVDYRLGKDVPEPPQIPRIFALGPHGFEKPIDVVQTSPGTYHGRLHIGDIRGLFRIRPLAESEAFPEIGFYRQRDELLDYGSNPDVLRQVSALSGGRFDPQPRDVFRSDGHFIPAVWRLWPGLLAFAIGVTILELAVRKWRGIVQRFSSR
jgi:Ca-activated chloride channel homolog